MIEEPPSRAGNGDDGFDEPFLVAASLSGEADAAWACAASAHVDAAILGGIALDSPSRAAARELVARDRSEFLPDSPIRFLDEQLSALEDAPVRPGFNLRSASADPIREAAAACADHGAVAEINAHCRQPELRAAGCGESLLTDVQRLRAYVAAAAEAGATTSVKVRTEVPGVDLVAVAETVAAAGGDWLHVDAMDSEPVVADLRAAIDDRDLGLVLVANNGVRGPETVAEYAAYGADAVSVGRPTQPGFDPAVLGTVADAVADWRAGSLDHDGGRPTIEGDTPSRTTGRTRGRR